jgi:hypothetical protein
VPVLRLCVRDWASPNTTMLSALHCRTCDDLDFVHDIT